LAQMQFRDVTAANLHHDHHHESKHGGAARKQGVLAPSLPATMGTKAKKKRGVHEINDAAATPPVGENMFPKQFYTRKNHPTAPKPDPRMDTLKPHVHKAVHAPLKQLRDTMKVASSLQPFEEILMRKASDDASLEQLLQPSHDEEAILQYKKQLRAQSRENKRRQHEAFQRLTRSWVKTPCVICNIEGHLMKDCPRNARRKIYRKIRKRIKYIVRPSSARRVRNRLLLSHDKKICIGTPDRHQLLPSLHPKERDRLRVLAFAVKKSLVQAVTWAEEARKTSTTVENARRAVTRHSHKISFAKY
jgi:hypothetical protein